MVSIKSTILQTPNDPIRARTEKQRAVATIKNSRAATSIIAERGTLDSVLRGLVEDGKVTSRTEMIELLQENGYEVTRQAKDSISIKHQKLGVRALRLKGGIYDESFKGIESLNNISRTEGRRERKSTARADTTIYKRYLKRRISDNQKRYLQPRRTYKKESSNLKARDSDELVAKIDKESERRVSDRIRKCIEESNKERTRSEKRARTRTRVTLAEIRERNEAVSRELTKSYSQSLEGFAKSERSVQEQVTETEQDFFREFKSRAADTGDRIDILSRSISGITGRVKRLTKSMQGVVSEIKKMKLFKEYKNKLVSKLKLENTPKQRI